MKNGVRPTGVRREDLELLEKFLPLFEFIFSKMHPKVKIEKPTVLVAREWKEPGDVRIGVRVVRCEFLAKAPEEQQGIILLLVDRAMLLGETGAFDTRRSSVWELGQILSYERRGSGDHGGQIHPQKPVEDTIWDAIVREQEKFSIPICPSSAFSDAKVQFMEVSMNGGLPIRQIRNGEVHLEKGESLLRCDRIPFSTPLEYLLAREEANKKMEIWKMAEELERKRREIGKSDLFLPTFP